ncbi:hypothetical protein BGZ76_011043 [Entomortierella beljakovae]|nr:hypothetical protein BGZ76_011043 [Entomortierella beljakovae]
MFDNLGPKLNGGKSPTDQNTNGNPSSNINRNTERVKDNVTNIRNNSIKINSPQGNSNSSGSGTNQGLSISRQANPFTKLRTNVSFQSKPNAKQPEAEITLRGEIKHTAQQSDRSVGVPNKPTGQQSTAKPSTVPVNLAQEAEDTFEEDVFLEEGVDLALENLLDDDEDDGYEEEPTISWPLTPSTRLTPSSQISQRTSSSSSSQPVSASNFTKTLASNVVAKPDSSHQALKNHSLVHGSSTNHTPTRKIETVKASSTPPFLPASSRILVPNSQEIPNSRPTVKDADISLKSRHVASDIHAQDRQGFIRSQSTPTANSRILNSPTRGGRKLPGPAGNLPKLSAEEKEQMFRSRGVPIDKDTRFLVAGNAGPGSAIKKKIKTAHQGPIDSMFATGAWEDMIRAYGLPDYKPSTLMRFKGTSPMIKFTIFDIESRPELHRSKISGLVVMIKDVSMSEIDAAVTLLDPSGEMRGTIHSTVLDQYKNNEIRVGTVLALKNVSVFSPTPVSHYLIITLRNIHGIFQPRQSTVLLSQGSSQDRMSQKRKLGHGESQNSQSTKHSTQGSHTSSLSDTPVTISASDRLPSLSPSWSDVPPDSAFVATANKSSASLEMLNMTLQEEKQAMGEYKKIKSEQHNSNVVARTSGYDSSKYPPLPQHKTQTQEIQFQSLRPSIGGSSVAVASDGAGIGDHALTPIITLGTMTPDHSTTKSVSENSKSILSSFAASPNLRKRSSQSQRSTTSNSPTQPFKKSFTSPSTSSQPPQSTQNDSSFADWHDDFDVADLENAMVSDKSYGSIDTQSPDKSLKHSDEGQPNPQVSAPQFPIRKDSSDVGANGDDDDDDLDNLLGGFDDADEAEWLNL